MKYQVEGTFTYTGCVEVEAESAQEAADYVRENQGIYDVNDIRDGEVEINDVYDEDGLPIREEWYE
jgi:hypothetical protein